MVQKTSKLKAAMFANASAALRDVIASSSLCESNDLTSERDDATYALGRIALVCRADEDEVDMIRAAGALPSP
ncbi:hypothetical protein D1007_07954 [Hordeum vulgare]|nr:hypothetical protein D1007_07954 [Hordeum vulgare]